jgi:hypothetical protein
MVGFINVYETLEEARWVNVERITQVYTNAHGQTVICLIDEEPIYTNTSSVVISERLGEYCE